MTFRSTVGDRELALQLVQVRCICFCVFLFLFLFCWFLFMLVSWGDCDKISLVVIARIKLCGLMRGAYIF